MEIFPKIWNSPWGKTLKLLGHAQPNSMVNFMSWVVQIFRIKSLKSTGANFNVLEICHSLSMVEPVLLTIFHMKAFSCVLEMKDIRNAEGK